MTMTSDDMMPKAVLTKAIEVYPRTFHCQVCPHRERPGRGLRSRRCSRRRLDDAGVDKASDLRVVYIARRRNDCLCGTGVSFHYMPRTTPVCSVCPPPFPTF